MRLEWTEEVAAQFLAALCRDGVVRFAAQEVGLSAQSAYAHKRRDAAFAARWEAAVAGVRATRVRQRQAAETRARAGRLSDQRTRHDGWTPRRQKIFLRALAQLGSLKAAADAARISTTAVYNRRRRFPAFDTACTRALAKAAPALEQAAYERGVEGWDEVEIRDGREYRRKRRYSDTMLKALMQQGRLGGPGTAQAAAKGPLSPKALVAQAREAAHAAGGFFSNKATRKEAEDALTRKLDMLAARLRAEGRAGPEGDA